MQISSYPKIDKKLASELLRPRPLESHKGIFGHLLLVAGHHGMMGAAVLCAEAALRAGLGKLTAHVPETANIIFQTRLPEAILQFDQQSHQHWASIIELNDYSSIVIGPGLVTDGETQWAFRNVMKQLLDREKTGNLMPLVLDADALNMLSEDYQLLSFLPAETILTPHLGEMKRLCCALDLPYETQEALLESAENIATSLQIHIVLKSHQTHVCTNTGEVFQLDTKGNSGLATAGSGDVLAGLIGGLLAQGYPAKDAALLGVYLHHAAAQECAFRLQPHCMLASDIISCLSQAFTSIVSSNHY